MGYACDRQAILFHLSTIDCAFLEEREGRVDRAEFIARGFLLFCFAMLILDQRMGFAEFLIDRSLLLVFVTIIGRFFLSRTDARGSCAKWVELVPLGFLVFFK